MLPVRANPAARRSALPQCLLHESHRPRLAFLEFQAGGGDSRRVARVEPAEHKQKDLGRELQQRQRLLVCRDGLKSGQRWNSHPLRGATASSARQLAGRDQTGRRLVEADGGGLRGLQRRERGRGHVMSNFLFATLSGAAVGGRGGKEGGGTVLEAGALGRHALGGRRGLQLCQLRLGQELRKVLCRTERHQLFLCMHISRRQAWRRIRSSCGEVRSSRVSPLRSTPTFPYPSEIVAGEPYPLPFAPCPYPKTLPLI